MTFELEVMKTKNTAFSVEILGNQCAPMQYVRELTQNSIEAIKTAVSLGLGAAFVSSSSIEKEIQLKQIKILKIENLNINRQLSIISNPECYKSKAFHLFYKELIRLKTKSKT